MTTFTDKELIKEIKERIGSLDVRDDIERRAYEIALASLEAEPVAWLHSDNGLGVPAITRSKNIADSWLSKGWYVQPLYIAKPVPVVPEEKPMPNPLSMYAVDAVAAIAEVRGWNSCRAAMLHGAEPVSQTYKLPPLSSSEVNDAAWKLHNMLTEHVPLNGRQFNNLKGCFYEALKVAMRNYPVTPDGWISCSERMPDDGQHVIILCDGAFVLYAQYRDGEFFDIVRNGDEFFETQSRNVTDWMRLPEPPQEVNRG